VVEAIRLHVDAKRALCALEPDYYAALSEDSKRSLALQGGVFSPDEAQAFLAKPFAATPCACAAGTTPPRCPVN
jgi:predicted HD phosphohydrolase